MASASGSNKQVTLSKEATNEFDSSGEDEGAQGDSVTVGKGGRGNRRRKDGTANKMSFDVDELEEGLYIQVEDEEDVEEVQEWEEIPDDETSALEMTEGNLSSWLFMSIFWYCVIQS